VFGNAILGIVRFEEEDGTERIIREALSKSFGSFMEKASSSKFGTVEGVCLFVFALNFESSSARWGSVCFGIYMSSLHRVCDTYFYILKKM